MTGEQQKVYNICKEVIDKYNLMKNNMRRYIIIDDDNTIWNAFDYFTIVFNHIKNLAMEYEANLKSFVASLY